METMTERDFQLWILQHGGEVKRVHNYRTIQPKDEYGRDDGPPRREVESTSVVAKDGSTITIRRNPGSAGFGGSEEVPDYTVESKSEPPEKEGRSPNQEALTQAQTREQEIKNTQLEQEAKEREYNARTPDEFGVVASETNAERAARIVKRREADRQQEATQQQIESSRASTEASRARIEQDRKELEVRQQEGAAGRALTARQVAEQERQGEYTRNKPEFLSRADKENQYVVRYDPATGGVVSEQNPNYDAVKAAAEEKRAELAAQIQARRMTLDEGTQAYKQWFDSNVQIPMLQAQEARARAEERRQALEAEERRRQFAADYKLRKAQLGETAANRATQAEISLLPYRAGPTAAAEMSSAINSLAAGGKISGPDASAGINFTPEAFQFSRPDFKQIAKDAMKSVLGGLTDYRPSDQEFSVGDYSGIPAINPSGAPSIPGIGAYQLPTPTPGADQPIP